MRQVGTRQHRLVNFPDHVQVRVPVAEVAEGMRDGFVHDGDARDRQVRLTSLYQVPGRSRRKQITNGGRVNGRALTRDLTRIDPRTEAGLGSRP